MICGAASGPRRPPWAKRLSGQRGKDGPSRSGNPHGTAQRIRLGSLARPKHDAWPAGSLASRAEGPRGE